MTSGRIDWIDYAKGICIILVVMMFSTLEYGHMVNQVSWLHALVAWATPFLVPTFFLLAGLFLSRSIFGAKTSFFDRKIVRFAYFYVIWLTLQSILFPPQIMLDDPVQLFRSITGALLSPTNSLWFIHLLALFYGVTWVLRFVPKSRILALAAVFQVLHAAGLIDTNWLVVNRFAAWYVFFFAGYAFSPTVFRYAEHLSEGFKDLPATLAVWAGINAAMVYQGTADLPVISMVFGFAGAMAVIAIATQLARKQWVKPVRYAGQNAFVIYLSFFIPMKAMQILLARTGLVGDAGLASLLVLAVALVSPLAFHYLVRNTLFSALYKRPQAFRLKMPRHEQQGRLLTEPQSQR